MSMSIEQAIKTAIEFEMRVKEVYKEAESKATNPTGKKVLSALVDEEQGHLDYLKKRLDEWQKTGKISPETLETTIPPANVIKREVKNLKNKSKLHDKEHHHSNELRMLRNALELENETSDFYKRMVSELPEEGQKMFARFVEIEEGHRMIVQAEIDYVSGPGYWFDFKEFDLAGGA
jgi:rubrerythrin